VHFDAVFQQATRILRFNREMKPTKTVQKLSKNSRSDQGAVAPSPPEYATDIGLKGSPPKLKSCWRHCKSLR